jgi:hypothetical protein
VYEGPDSWPGQTRPGVDLPVAAERVWPVRPPGAPDGNRVLLMVLGWLSIALLGWALILSLAALLGKSIGTGYFLVILIGAALSFMTHALTLVRLWVRR